MWDVFKCIASKQKKENCLWTRVLHYLRVIISQTGWDRGVQKQQTYADGCFYLCIFSLVVG